MSAIRRQLGKGNSTETGVSDCKPEEDSRRGGREDKLRTLISQGSELT